MKIGELNLQTTLDELGKVKHGKEKLFNRKMVSKKCKKVDSMNNNDEIVFDGIKVAVEAEELDYVDDAPNPMDLENERIMDLEDNVIFEVPDEDSSDLPGGISVDEMTQEQQEKFLNNNPYLK